MKKIQQVFANILPLAALTVMLLTGCAKNKLQKAVNDLNEKCPITLGQFIRMMGASYENDCVFVRYMLDERLINIDAMRSNEDLMKQQLLATYSNPDKDKDIQNFVDVILDAQATVEFTYEGSLSGEKISVSITPEELKKAQEDTVLSPEENLAAMIFMANAQTPITLVQGMVMTAMQQEGNGVYYIYEVSDSILFDNLQTNINNLKADIRRNLENLSEVEKADIRRVPAADKFLGYRYINVTTGQLIEITFTKSQLSDILR